MRARDARTSSSWARTSAARRSFSRAIRAALPTASTRPGILRVDRGVVDEDAEQLVLALEPGDRPRWVGDRQLDRLARRVDESRARWSGECQLQRGVAEGPREDVAEAADRHAATELDDEARDPSPAPAGPNHPEQEPDREDERGDQVDRPTGRTVEEGDSRSKSNSRLRISTAATTSQRERLRRAAGASGGRRRRRRASGATGRAGRADDAEGEGGRRSHSEASYNARRRARSRRRSARNRDCNPVEPVTDEQELVQSPGAGQSIRQPDDNPIEPVSEVARWEREEQMDEYPERDCSAMRARLQTTELGTYSSAAIRMRRPSR